MVLFTKTISAYVHTSCQEASGVSSASAIPASSINNTRALPINLIQELCGLKPTAVILTDSAVQLRVQSAGPFVFLSMVLTASEPAGSLKRKSTLGSKQD